MTMTAIASRSAILGLAAGLLAPHQLRADSGLDRFRWENRLVLSFVETDTAKITVRQRNEREADPGAWKERDLLLIEIAAEAVRVDGRPSKDLSAAALRARFDVPEGTFRAILIGKDGGAKLRSGSPIGNRTLFETIDAMPMRQNEMRRQ